MKRTPITFPDGTETVAVGNGFEGVLNGAGCGEFAADLTGSANPATARVYLKSTRGGVFVQNGVAYALAAGAPRRLDLSNLAGYEMKITLTIVTGTGADTVVPCEFQAQRGA